MIILLFSLKYIRNELRNISYAKKLICKRIWVYKDKEEIFYKYKLCMEKGVWISTIYNKLIKGAILEGKVVAVQNEQVKLQLSIDKNQDKGTAHWFNYAPPSVNIMYSMPLVGESARLYFPKESSEDPIVIGCIRQNGDTCDETSSPANKYFQTESGNEIAMLPNELHIKGGSKKNISISFDDKKGVHLKSPNTLSLNATREIVLKTKKKVKIKAQSKISTDEKKWRS